MPKTKKRYWELKYEIKCSEHGKVVNHVSGYPPRERVDCPVKNCNFSRLLRIPT